MELVKHLLAEIKPKLESPRLAEAYERLRNAYALRQNDHHPIVQFDWTHWGRYTSLEMAKDPAKNLEQHLLYLKGSLDLGTDYTPMMDLSEPWGTAIVPDAFGCGTRWMGDEPPWSYPIITDVSQVFSIRKPRVSDGCIIQEIKRHIDYAKSVMGGSIPMLVVDMQSPFSVACQIWEWESLMTACCSSPQAAHHFLRIVTEFSIEFLQEYLTWLENPLFPGRNFPSIPENIGINIADDTAAIMLSPEQYEEFALPYNIMVSQAFGGLSIHSCGNYNHQLDNLLKIPNLKAIQCHVGPGEMPAEPLVGKINGKATLWCDWNNLSCGSYASGKELQQEYTIPYLRRFKTGLIVQGPGGANPRELVENYIWLRNQLWTC